MSKKKISPELREFFAEEVRLNSNSTLETARWHLRDFYERGPEDPVLGEIAATMSEVDELLVVHDEHTPLTEFL
jgi:hypothetical protein